MPFRPSPHHQRRLCGLMLLLWLFALLSGTVNACVLADSAPPALAPHSEHAHHHDAVEDETHAHAEDAAHHHADEHVACHKFCKDEARTLPHNKHQGDVDFTPVLLLYGSPLLPPTQAIAPAARAPQRPLAHGPPLVIRLLRLTL